MGALYIAATGDRGLERLLVIKTVLPHLADKEYVARFRDEAKVVIQLSHQNLIQVFDAGQVDGELFLAMDLIEGKDLRAVWNRCAKKGVAFPLDVAVFVVKELCRGLGYAHSQGDLGVVHRDVSPPNVIVSYRGEVKLTDFGLAASTLKLEKTAPGIVYGKVSYMSPEQARGEKLDGRSDLYAAAIILWELLTGRQLYPASADQGQDLLDRSRNPTVPAPSSRAPRVPAELDAILARALASRPDDRYQNGEQFREALATWLAAHHPTTDAARVERFLVQLFGDDITAERLHRRELLHTTRERVATLPPSHELHKLFGIAQEDLDRRLNEGPNLGRRAIDEGDDASDRRQVGGRRAVDKIAEGVGTMLGLQPSAPMPGGYSGAASGQAAAAEAEVLLTEPRTTPDAESVIGTILDGRYRIDELLGEGGMGRVYLGVHVDIGRTVAIKILHAVYSNMPDLVERFRREARAATRIGHPNIVDVTDSGTTADGSTYFVMEYLEGVELGSVIDKEGALEVGRALAVGTQICRALAAAHAVDIIHRDLKPENVFLTTRQGVSDFVKVLDFGIAKTGEAEKARERRLTSPGVAMGTPEYMAPEQAAGKPADERCDIYAVGAILYEMLTGLPPYEGDNFMEILSKKATSEPTPLATLRPDVPEVVAALVSQAMARDPAERPSSMEVFEYELTKLSSGRGVAVANAIGLSADVGDVRGSNPPLLARAATHDGPSHGGTTPARGRSVDVAPVISPVRAPSDVDEDAETSIVEAEISGVRDAEARIAEAIDVELSDSISEPASLDSSNEDEREDNRLDPLGAPEGKAAPVSAAASVPPAPFESQETDLRVEPAVASRGGRIGWVAFLGALLLLGVGLGYVIVKERGSASDPDAVSGSIAGSSGGDGKTVAPALGVDASVPASPMDASSGAPIDDGIGVPDANGVGEATDKDDPDKNDPDKNDPDKNDPDKNDPDKNDPDKNDKNDPDKNDKNDNKARKDPKALIREGAAALASGKVSDARRFYREAVEAGSRSAGYMGLSRVAFESGDLEQAINHGKRAGSGKQTLRWVGDLYFKRGDCKNARVYYQKLVDRYPSADSRKALSRCKTD